MQRPDHYMLLKEDMISFNEDLGMPDLTYGWAKLTHEYCARLAYENMGFNLFRIVLSLAMVWIKMIVIHFQVFVSVC